jgi:hypothetical protein
MLGPLAAHPHLLNGQEWACWRTQEQRPSWDAGLFRCTELRRQLDLQEQGDKRFLVRKNGTFETTSRGGRSMSNAPTSVSEHDAIAKTVQHYIDGAKSGRGADMKPAFHQDATIFGYVGADLFAGPIQQLFDWNDQNGPATGLQARIASIDIIDTIAAVRLELDNWTGHRFTDLFTLLKVNGEWKIMNKVFHLHLVTVEPAAK